MKSAISRRPDEDRKRDIFSASQLKNDGSSAVDVSARHLSLQPAMKQCRDATDTTGQEPLTGCPPSSPDPKIQAMCDPVTDLDSCFDTSADDRSKGKGCFRYWGRWGGDTWENGWVPANDNQKGKQGRWVATVDEQGEESGWDTKMECSDCTGMWDCHQDCLQDPRCHAALFEEKSTIRCQLFEGLPPIHQRKFWRFQPEEAVVWIKGFSMTVNGVVSDG